MLRIWAGLRSEARCRTCRQRIVFVTTDQGKRVPLERGFVAEIQQRDEQGRRFELVDRGARHRCEARQP